MKGLVKQHPVKVLLDGQDERDLARAVKLERERRKDATVGAGTLLRELAMPRIRELLAAEQAAA